MREKIDKICRNTQSSKATRRVRKNWLQAVETENILNQVRTEGTAIKNNGHFELVDKK